RPLASTPHPYTTLFRSDPASPRNALLVECGQHWEAASAPIALHSALRFLLVNDVVDADWASQGLEDLVLPEQRFVEVTGPVTIRSEEHTSELQSRENLV